MNIDRTWLFDQYGRPENIEEWYVWWVKNEFSASRTVNDLVSTCPFNIVTYAIPSKLVSVAYSAALDIIDTTRWCRSTIPKDDWYAVISSGPYSGAKLRTGFHTDSDYNHVAAIIFRHEKDAVMFSLMFYDYLTNCNSD